ncbi:hypothetical protein C7212DRAFT_340389 [Tuber magnatum]|uniref:Uncharacterized protein n=1 Tax=Tuber magnatum TaxID=42249 RepID=A0A317SZZ6_9PEZI|nr:hypothetical protein C7212DRAFT_340389 [Tuber magnatum]
MSELPVIMTEQGPKFKAASPNSNREPEEEVEQAVLHVAMPFASIEYRDHWTISDLGHMSVACSTYNTLHWQKEQARRKDSGIVGSFESRCKHGDVGAERLRALPEPLKTLMTGQDGPSRAFQQDLHVGMPCLLPRLQDPIWMTALQELEEDSNFSK